MAKFIEIDAINLTNTLKLSIIIAKKIILRTARAILIVKNIIALFVLGGKNFKIEEVRLPQEVKSEDSSVDKENTEVEIKQEKIESENTPNKKRDKKSKSELDDSKTISDDANSEDKENEKIEIKQEKAESAKKLTKIRSKQSEKVLDDSENIENSKSQESSKKDEILSTMLAVNKAVRSRKTKKQIRGKY